MVSKLIKVLVTNCGGSNTVKFLFKDFFEVYKTYYMYKCHMLSFSILWNLCHCSYPFGFSCNAPVYLEIFVRMYTKWSKQWTAKPQDVQEQEPYQAAKEMVLSCLTTLSGVHGQQVESEFHYSITLCALWSWLYKGGKLSAHLCILMLSNKFAVQKPSKTHIASFIYSYLIKNKTKHINTRCLHMKFYELMNFLELLLGNETLYWGFL